MNKVLERKRQRFQLLKALYEKSGGNTSIDYDLVEIGKGLGLDKQTVDLAIEFFRHEGLVDCLVGGHASISHQGVKEVERALGTPEEPTQHFPAVVNMLGDFQGAIVNVASNLTSVSQSVGALSGVDETVKQELKRLVEKLEEALQSTPQEKTEEAGAVAWAAESLIEAVTEKRPNRVKVEITKEGLVKAAQNMAAAMPIVLSIVTQIISVINQLTPK
jgi:ElaB/YqjD/DUF883 family membrane-anchored ribosome-binding protein